MDTQDYAPTTVDEYSEQLQQLFTGPEHGSDANVYKTDGATIGNKPILHAVTPSTTSEPNEQMQCDTSSMLDSLVVEAVKEQVSEDKQDDVEMESIEPEGTVPHDTDLPEVKEEIGEAINTESSLEEDVQKDTPDGQAAREKDTINEKSTEETGLEGDSSSAIGKQERTEEVVVTNGAKDLFEEKSSEPSNTNSDLQIEGKLQELVTIEEISNSSTGKYVFLLQVQTDCCIVSGCFTDAHQNFICNTLF